MNAQQSERELRAVCKQQMWCQTRNVVGSEPWLVNTLAWGMRAGSSCGFYCEITGYRVKSSAEQRVLEPEMRCL